MMIDVKTLCLGVLSRGDASGYEIRKAFDDGALSHFSDAGFGSIYPALKRLLDDGLITMLPQSSEARPDKKVYRITAAGRHSLYQTLTRQPAPDKLRSDLLFMLSFAHMLPARHVERLINDRISSLRRLVDDLTREESRSDSAGDKFVEGYSLALYQAGLSYLEEHGRDLITAAHYEAAKVAE